MEAAERLDLRVRQQPHETGLVETVIERSGRRFHAVCGCGVSTRLVATEAKAHEDALDHVAAMKRQEATQLQPKQRQLFDCDRCGRETYEVPVKIGAGRWCRECSRIRLEDQTEASFWEPNW